jgi:hypothetical protein
MRWMDDRTLVFSAWALAALIGGAAGHSRRAASIHHLILQGCRPALASYLQHYR